jgi:hypothetical protein
MGRPLTIMPQQLPVFLITHLYNKHGFLQQVIQSTYLVYYRRADCFIYKPFAIVARG